MRIASFTRSGRIDCGLVDRGGFRILDQHPALGPLPSEHRIFALLAMSPEERKKTALELADAPLVSRREIRPLAAVPLAPLYFYNHANNPTVWKRQTVPPADLTRIPYMRVRPFSSFSGDGATLRVPAGHGCNGGAEFGAVIGRPAFRVPIKQAREHIAGLVVLHDAYIYAAQDDATDTSSPAATANQRQGLDTLRKSADLNGTFGPWVVTSEDLEAASAAHLAPPALERYRKNGFAPWLYDKSLRTVVDGRLTDESHSSAYLYDVEWMIAYFSRFLTLPTGTILGLGAPGWDGIVFPLNDTPGDTRRAALEISDVGKLRVNIRRATPSDEKKSPFLRARKRAGLPPVPAPTERPAPAFWVLRGNYGKAPEAEGIPEGRGMNPNLFPSHALDASNRPLILPPHATEIRVSVQLAGVIGPQAVYQAKAEKARRFFSHVALIAAVRDTSLGDPIRSPNAYENRAVWFLGACGDGFFRMAAPVPLKEAGDLATATFRLDFGGQSRSCFAADYLHTLEEMVALVTRGVTLLPGDILSLGVMAPEIILFPEHKAAALAAEASWGSKLQIPVEDQRSPSAQDT